MVAFSDMGKPVVCGIQRLLLEPKGQLLTRVITVLLFFLMLTIFTGTR